MPEDAPRRSPAALARRVGLPVAGLLVGLAVWWLVTTVVAQPADLLARFNPRDAFAALWSLVTGDRLWTHAVDSLRRLAIGLGFATALGLPIGLAVGLSRTLRQATGPLFQLLRMVSPLSWAPIALIAFGVGNRTVSFLIAVAAVWPIVLNTAAGVKALEPGWLQVARSLGSTRWELLRAIVLPGVRAHVLTGVRVALGVAWIVLVPAEMLGVNSGLGYFVLDTRDRLAYDELMATILFIGAIGYLLDSAAQRLTRRRPRRTRRPGPSEAVPEPRTVV
jgi:NitT/TauT family transport system permease protein